MGNSLDSELKNKQGSVDSSGPVKTAGQMYVCRVPRTDGTAVHIWLQCYETGWKPTENLRRIVGLETFNKTLLAELINPALETILLFCLRLKKVHVTHIIHANFPSPLIDKKELLELWKFVISRPLSPRACFLKIEVDTQIETLHRVDQFITTVPAYIGEMLKSASALRRPVMGPLVRYVSKQTYGELSALQEKVHHTDCMNAFMERFYASPDLLSEIKAQSSKKTAEKQALRCQVEWEIYTANGYHSYVLLPMREAFLWDSIDEKRLKNIANTKGLLLIVMMSFDRESFFTIMLGIDDRLPLPGRPPLTNYIFGCLERPPRYICSQCSKDAVTMSRCMRCKAARYCSEECRDLHWKAGHKKVCKGIASLLGFPVDVVKA